MSTYTDIVVTVSVPFSKRDYARFGIAEFRARGFHVRVLDVSHISQTRYSQHVENQFDDLEVFAPPTVEILAEYLNAHRSALFVDFCDLHSNVFTEIRKPFSELRIDCLLPVINDIPGSEFMKYQNDDGYYPKYIVIGAAYSMIRIPTYAQDTKFIPAHALDYDHYIKFRKENEHIVLDNSILFIDQYMPFHPDNEELKHPYIDPKKYFGGLCNFFSILESNLGGSVVVAVHPRAQYADHPDYFGGRRLVQGDTIDLVAKSKLVLAHSSTAMNYAVLFLKPIMLVTSDVLDQTTHYFYLKRYEEELGIKAINLDHLPTGNIQVGASRNHYWLFREKFIKIRNTPERFFWDIVIDAL